MEKIFKSVFVFIAAFSFLGAAFMPKPDTEAKEKGDKPAVTYYRNESNMVRAEADTNYDGKSDIILYVDDGKFKSAEVDIDYDGKADKKFNDASQFKQWVNDNTPEFSDSLDWQKWSKTIDKVFWKPGGKQ